MKNKKQKLLLTIVSGVVLLLVIAIISAILLRSKGDSQNSTETSETEAPETEVSETEVSETETPGEPVEESSSDDETAEEDVQTADEDPVDDVETIVDRYGALAVEGNQLVDQNGNAVALKGVSTFSMAWYPRYVNEESFRFMRDEWGIDVVRLAMYTDEGGGYGIENGLSVVTRRNLKDLIDEGVQAAAKLGIYVIIDWHVLREGDPNKYKDLSVEFFTEMADKYKDYNNVIYEICNEPNGDVTWQDIKDYASEVIPVIRQSDEDAIILVGTPSWSQEVDKAQADPITEYDNLMYVLHFYADSHRDELRNTLKQAHDGGLPIFVSEFGICANTGRGPINIEEGEKWIELLDSCNISYVAWGLSNKMESAAFFTPPCKKSTDFTDEDLTDHAKWFIETIKD